MKITLSVKDNYHPSIEAEWVSPSGVRVVASKTYAQPHVKGSPQNFQELLENGLDDLSQVEFGSEE